jgi:sulfur carrier protein
MKTGNRQLTTEKHMQLLVNNKPEELLSGNRLSALLAQIHLADKRGIAVAVNNAVIAKPDWNGHTLNENDKITIITPTQGG